MSSAAARAVAVVPALIVAVAAGDAVEIGSGFEPDWSPDGKRIAFTRTHAKNRDIHIADADGSNDRRITRTAEPEFFPRWSPDGKWLAFVRGFGPQARLVLSNLDETDERVLDTGAAIAMVPPAWAPECDRIAFAGRASDPDDPAGERPDMDLFVVTVDSGKIVRLTRAPSNEWDPAWSPDGRRVAFVSDRGADPDLFVMDIGRDRQAVAVMRRAGTELGPSWSPDGDWIAFTAKDGDKRQVFKARADGTDLERLTSGEGTKSYSRWSPEGGALLFVILGKGRGAEDRIMILRNPVDASEP